MPIRKIYTVGHLNFRRAEPSPRLNPLIEGEAGAVTTSIVGLGYGYKISGGVNCVEDTPIPPKSVHIADLTRSRIRKYSGRSVYSIYIGGQVRRYRGN